MCVYFAVCCLVYISVNLWVGWAVVCATAVWMAYATIRAFQTRNHFTLGFAVAGCAWLIVWLGFAIETKTDVSGWNVRSKITNIMRLGRETPEHDVLAGLQSFTHMHHLYRSELLGILPDQRLAPEYHNSVRLFVCLTSLIFGLLGGIVFHVGFRIGANRPEGIPIPITESGSRMGAG